MAALLEFGDLFTVALVDPGASFSDFDGGGGGEKDCVGPVPA